MNGVVKEQQDNIRKRTEEENERKITLSDENECKLFAKISNK